MKKLFVMLCMLLLLVSCTAADDIIHYPDESDLTDLNGYRSGAVESDTYNTVGGYFVVNTKTEKFHISSCSHADKIADSDRLISTDRGELVKQGYAPCKSCLP